MPAARRLLTLAAVGAALTAMAACGSSSSSASAAGSSTSAGAPATSATAAPSSAAASPTPAGASAGAPDAAAFCAFLTKGLPEWKAVGAKAAAQAQYTIAVAGWAGDKLTLDLVQQLDAGAQQTCPKVRADVLALIGQSTLAG